MGGDGGASTSVFVEPTERRKKWPGVRGGDNDEGEGGEEVA